MCWAVSLCAAGSFLGHHNVLGKLLGRTALPLQHTFGVGGEYRQPDFEVRAPLSTEERSFQALKDHLGFSSSFMYSFGSALPFFVASWLGPRNKMMCVQWPWSSNLCFNSCPRRTVDISGRWSAKVSCKYLKVFAKASANFLGWFCSNAFLYLSWLQIKCQLMNCNNSLSLQIYFVPPVLI